MATKKAYGHGEQPEWPQFCQFQNRRICQACWYGIHTKHRVGTNEVVDACDGPCECLHLTEKSFAQEERATNRKERKKLMKDALEVTPLRAQNPEFKKPYSGRTPA